MIIGIGVDIAETARIDRLLREYGDRFAHRILTDFEFSEFSKRKRCCHYLATRFAAKEAVAKAMGTGIGKDLGFQSIQIENDARGKPGIKLLGGAASSIAGQAVRNALVSLSDEKHYVVAMVVLES